MGFDAQFKIKQQSIGIHCPVYIIAEMSANHGQSLSKAKELVYAAKEAGADAIKLQTYRADTLTMKSGQAHFFIQEGPWQGQYLYDLYEKAYMPWDFHAELFELADKLGIHCFSSPFDHSAVDLLEQLNAPAYKIASPELIEHSLIERVAQTGKPLIMSTGGATLAEIVTAVKVAKEAGIKQLCLLKCTSHYPAPATSINLKTIPHMQQTFNCPVGLSDHTLGIDIPIASVAMGVSMLEKHFVMDRSDQTADSFFSVTPEQLQALVKGVRQVEQALGSVHYEDTPSAKRRCLYAIQDIALGEPFSRHNTASLRPGGGELQPQDLSHIIGRTAQMAIKRGQQLSWSVIGGEAL